MTLHATLQVLATTFVEDLLEAIRGASMGELLASPDGSTKYTKDFVSAYPKIATNAAYGKTTATRLPIDGRLKRRSLEQIREAVVSVRALLDKHPEGLRSETIKAKLLLDVREVPRILKQAIDDKAIVILSGQKRATVYAVRGAKAAPKPKKPAPKKAVKKPAKKVARKASPKKTARKVPPKKATQKTARKASPKKARKAAPRKATAKKRPDPVPTAAAPPIAAE